MSSSLQVNDKDVAFVLPWFGQTNISLRECLNQIMPRPYLLEVFSQPTKVSEDIWKKWYLEEHIRDMVYFKASRTGAFYLSSSDVLYSGDVLDDGSEAMSFLALYQTDRKHCLEYPEFQDHVRRKSSLWDEGLISFDVGNFVPRESRLIEILGSYEHNEDVAPHIVHVVITGEEVESKLQFEHVNAVSVLDGYRRTLLHRLLDQQGTLPTAILIHEFESLDASHLPSVKMEMEAIEPTKDCVFQLRSFQLLDSEGFGGQCRVPERL